MKLEDLIDFFDEIENLPDSIQLDRTSRITDVQGFIQSHVTILQANKGNKSFMPYYLRLVQLYNILKQKESETE